MTAIDQHTPALVDLAPVCPECRAGKHRNCDGTALNETTDDITDCICPPAFHPTRSTP